MIDLITHHGLLAVVVMVFLAEIGVPTFVSPKIALLLVGSASLHSPFGFVAGVLCVSLANLVGAFVLHTAARTGGPPCCSGWARKAPGLPGTISAGTRSWAGARR